MKCYFLLIFRSISQIKHPYALNDQILFNLPIVRKVKIKMIDNLRNDEIKQILLSRLKKINVISLNEIITINKEIRLDLFYGIFSNKNEFYNFIVSEIEFEDFDKLRNYLNNKNENILKIILNTSKDKNLVYDINAFFIPNDKIQDIQVEIIPNDFSTTISFTKLNLKFINNLYKKIYCKSYEEIYESIYFTNIKQAFKENIQSGTVTIFLNGPIHCGINYILRNLTDEIGYRYFVKDFNKFTSIEKFITYLKKIEFLSPCIVRFKNSKRLHQLITQGNSGEHNLNYINEIKSIIELPRENNRIIFIFNFENSSEIDKSLNILSDVHISYSHPDINTRINLLKTGMKNLFFNLENIFNNKLGKKIKKAISNHSIVDSIEEINFFDVSKTIVGYDIKELKSIVKFIFEEYYSQISTTDDNKIKLDNLFIKRCIQILKQTRLKNEKTISSIPEVKWEDVGGLDHAKEDINDTIQLPLKYPKLFESKFYK
jgi:hypothetical protein